MTEFSTGAKRIYRMGWFQRIFCVVFMLGAVCALILFWSGAITGNREATLPELLVPLGLLTIGGFLTAGAFKNYIELAESEISLQTALTRKTLPFSKIRGHRRYLDKGGYESPSVWCLKLEPNDDRFPSIEFQETSYTLDEFFYAWFNALPDLDELDKRALKTSEFGLV